MVNVDTLRFEHPCRTSGSGAWVMFDGASQPDFWGARPNADGYRTGTAATFPDGGSDSRAVRLPIWW
jgi:hypothetical protein